MDAQGSRHDGHCSQTFHHAQVRGRGRRAGGSLRRPLQPFRPLLACRGAFRRRSPHPPTHLHKRHAWSLAFFPRKGGVVPLRPWQLVPGTQFVVDRFDSLPPSLPQHRHWFLTHFHADHYKGLTGK